MSGLKIVVPPGVGDFSWVYSKLAPLGRDLSVKAVGKGIHRSQQFAEMLPLVKEFEYDDSISYEDVVKITEERMPDYRRMSYQQWQTTDETIYLGINGYLERGKRLENILPKLGCDFHYEVPTPLPRVSSPVKYFVIHTQSINSCAYWKAWMPDAWASLASLLRRKTGIKTFILLGGKEDEDALEAIAESIPACEPIMFCGQDFASVVSVLQHSAYNYSFCSGIGILSTVLKTPVSMFYHDHLLNLRYSWAPPESITSGSYLPFLHSTPIHEVFNLSLPYIRL